MLSEERYLLRDVQPVIPGPVFYVMAVEVGNWDAAVRACVLMLRSNVNEDLWRMRLCGALRARRMGRREQREVSVRVLGEPRTGAA